MYRGTRNLEIADLDLDGESLQDVIDHLSGLITNHNIIPKDNPMYNGEPYIDIIEYYGSISVRLMQRVYTETAEEFEQRKLKASVVKDNEVEQLKRRLRELGEAI